MKIASQKRLARALIRGNLRWAAKDRRRVARHVGASAAFQYGFSASSISMAKCCGLITRAEADRYDARLKKITTARITRTKDLAWSSM